MKDREFRITLPDKEPYEGKATQKQKQKLWDLGCRDQAIIDSLGKKQASFLIDAMLRDSNRRSSAPLIICGILLGIGGAIIFHFFHGEQAEPVTAFLSICGIGCGALMFLAGLFRALS